MPRQPDIRRALKSGHDMPIPHPQATSTGRGRPRQPARRAAANFCRPDVT